MSSRGGDVQLTAGWAMWGKRPGSGDDYWVLESSSEPVGAQDFARILAHFEPGTPPIERGRPDSLPWVTISWMSINEQSYVGMALQEATDDLDRVGRPITRTSYFCLPYESLASGPVSYVSLYRALAAVRLPWPGGAPVQVTVPVLDPATLANDVTKLGEVAVSSAAALLLRGAVSVVGADGSTLEQRLRFIDAVAALLPYGYRAANTAATWADSGARHRIKLAFAARVKEGASGVAWRSAQPPPADPDGPAVSYQQQFRQLRGHRTDADGLTDLIGFLARDTAARGFDAPDPAIDGLREFDLPFAVLDDVHRQAADPTLVRQVFATSRIPELPAAGRHDLLAALIASGDVADVAVARAWWDRAATGDPGVLVAALAETVRGFLWRTAPNRHSAETYLRLAAEHELTDPLLARLVPPPAGRLHLIAGRDAIARMIADWVFVGESATARPQTRQALAGSPLVYCALIAQLAGPEPGPAAVLDWLRPVPGVLHAPFAAALGPAPASVTLSQVTALVGQDAECARLLLAAANTAGRLDRVLPGFGEWVTQATGVPGHASYWRDVLTALTATSMSERAWIDLTLLALTDEPRFLLTDEAGVPDYSGAFVDGWNRLTAGPRGQAVDWSLVAALTGFLRRRPWSRDQASATIVADIVERLAAGGRRQQLEAQVAATVAATPGARAWRSVRGWLDRLQRDRPNAVRDGTLSLLREPSAGASCAEIAALCVQSFNNNLTASQTAAELAQSGTVRSGTDALQVLYELRHLLPQSGPAAAWMLDFIRSCANSNVGWSIASQFRELAVEQAFNEIEFWLALLSAGASGGQPAAVPPTLPEEAIRRLEQISKTVDHLLKETRPRSRFRGGQRKDEGKQTETSGHQEGTGT